jgi:hypothetical protein
MMEKLCIQTFLKQIFYESEKGQLLLPKWSEQTAVIIYESLYV